MCVGIPMKLVTIEGTRGVVASGTLEVEISLALLPDARPGDHVLVHAAFALERIDEAEAEETLEMLREVIRRGDEDG